MDSPTRPRILLGGRREWHVLPPLHSDVRSVLGTYHPVLAQLLYNRRIATDLDARSFLSNAPISHDPFLLPGMKAAIPRIIKAIQGNERIGVFGDFDVDGISATALLATALGSLGCTIVPYIPHRVDEGHGLSYQAVEYLAKCGVSLLITVDCGVSSHGEIEAAAKVGIDTIVTDHHLPPPHLPDAYAVIDHRLPDSRYPFDGLTGAGVALKLSQALYHSMGGSNKPPEKGLVALAALGTIADVAPLLDENRSIVREGLRSMGQLASPGLRALMRSARIEGNHLSADAIGWVIAPRLNAAGRVGHANLSYRLLMTQSHKEAEQLAYQLEQQNRRRQQMTQEAYEKAVSLLGVYPWTGSEQALLMVGDETFSPGIIGLVAGRLAEEYARPAVVVSVESDFSSGSCRSIRWFNIGKALYDVADAVGGFIRHGGHAQAAGFTIATPRLTDLRNALVEQAGSALRDGADQHAIPRPSLDVDMELSLGDLSRNVYPIIQTLAPFGPQNEEPVFLSRNVGVSDVRKLGAEGQHVRFSLQNGRVTWSAIAFRQGDRLPAGASRLDVVYSLDVDRWNGVEALQLRVLDFRIAGG